VFFAGSELAISVDTRWIHGRFLDSSCNAVQESECALIESRGAQLREASILFVVFEPCLVEDQLFSRPGKTIRLRVNDVGLASPESRPGQERGLGRS